MYGRYCILHSNNRNQICILYWDKDKKQPRCRRKLLGRVDENGNIVPTGRRGRKPKTETAAKVVPTEASQAAELEQSLAETRKQLADARAENQSLAEENAYLKKILEDLTRHVEEMNDLIAALPDPNS